MKRDKLIKPILVTIAMLTICGCSRSRAEEEVNNEVDYVTSFDAMTPGYYYVCDNQAKGDEKRYLLPYADRATFKLSDTGSGDKRSLYYGEDFAKVPTMHKGDTLVYYTPYSLKSETFTFEKFEYVGYSVGLVNLSETETGRYAFAAKKKDSPSICLETDAEKLRTLGADRAIIENISDIPLREANISRGGIIEGLLPEKSYKADIYVGTVLHEQVLKADTIFLTSSDNYKTTDYRYIRSDIIEIELPEEFDSGYYFCSGVGLFRYDKGTASEEPEEVVVDEIKEEKLALEQAGSYRITIEVEGNSEDMPKARLITKDGAFAFMANESSLELEKELEAGEYTVKISNLKGRKITLKKEPV